MICVSSIKLNYKCLSLQKGRWFYNMQAEVSPANATCNCISWSSADTSIVSVGQLNGHIYGVGLSDIMIIIFSGANSGCLT